MGIIIAIGIFFLIYLLWKKGLIRSLFEPKISKIYALLIMHLNQYAFQNRGTPTYINNRKLQIYKTDSPQIIYLELNQNDDLQIEWRYKYYQQEMIFRYTVKRVAFDTHDMAKTEFYFNDIIQKFKEKLALHKEVIDNRGIPEKIVSELGISAQNLKNARNFLSQDKVEEKKEQDKKNSISKIKQQKIADDLLAINNKLKESQNLPNIGAKINFIPELIDTCMPRLINIKNTLGATDDFYLKTSDSVAANAINILGSAIYDAQHSKQFSYEFVDIVYEKMILVQSLDMTYKLKQQFQANIEILDDWKQKIISAFESLKQ